MDGVSVEDIEKEINDKVKSEVKEKLVNLIMHSNNFEDIKWKLEHTINDIQRNIEYEIKSALGKQLNEAKKQLDCLISPKIIDRVNEFENQICNILKDHAESITNFQQETLNKFRSEVLPISNLYIINKKINVIKRVNAEDYVRSKLEQQGFKVVKQSCDPGIPDFAIYKKIGEDKNLLEMDSYHLLKMESNILHQRNKMTQYQWENRIELPVYSEEPLYVEVKTNGDGLRMHQLEWIKKHPNSKVIVYCVEQIIE